MIPLRLRRKHLRAPLNTHYLFEGDRVIEKGLVENISEGGLLLSGRQMNSPKKPFSIYFDLPEIVNFSSMPISEILSVGKENFKHHIIFAELEMRRALPEGENKKHLLGCEFTNIDHDSQSLIKEYVSNYAANIIFTLALFEQGVHRQDVKELIQKSVNLMNYPLVDKMTDLRQKLLHDYQSLESL